MNHLSNCEDLIQQFSDKLRYETYRMYPSGAIDHEAYKGRDYALAKILVTAAIHVNKDYFAPVHNLYDIDAVHNLEAI